MQIPPDADIPIRKLTHYLLVAQLKDDKSKFLARGGFVLENHSELEHAIRRLAAEQPAYEDRADKFGRYYRVDGWLTGVNNRSLPVTLVWIQWDFDGSFHFVTLKPRKVK
jgi:hypothetical protein